MELCFDFIAHILSFHLPQKSEASLGGLDQTRGGIAVPQNMAYRSKAR